MENAKHFLYNYLVKLKLNEDLAIFLNMVFLLTILIIVVFLIDVLIKKILFNAFTKFAQATKTSFDDILIKNRVPNTIAHILPLLLALQAIPYILSDYPDFEAVVLKILRVLAIWLILSIVRCLLNSFKDFFKTLPSLKDKPIDSYIQVFMIFARAIGIFSAFAIITETEISTFFTALGAASAVIILVFRDTILGFVASIQVSINDMVRIGDWITFSKYGADGDVIEINLATVKVQNFDKTITTIPTYALISDSFKNWRGMVNSDGRRIKRALKIKMSSVHYLTDEEVVKYLDFHLIGEYVSDRKKEIDDYNQKNNIDKSITLNGRNLTNLGVFRKYVETYLENHSAINKDMMIMARQLEPTSEGIPIEIYAFSKDKRWHNYEYIIADIFDHVIAAVPSFNLEIFEQPSGKDILKLKS